MWPLCQDYMWIVLDLERVRPGPPDKGISRLHLVFTENTMAHVGPTARRFGTWPR
jgi:hypothetical protein